MVMTPQNNTEDTPKPHIKEKGISISGFGIPAAAIVKQRDNNESPFLHNCIFQKNH